MDLESPKAKVEKTNPIHDEVLTQASTESKHTLQRMPLYLGEYEWESFTLHIPSILKPLDKLQNKAHVQSILSTHVTSTPPLVELL